jgi:hypothetical protein
MGPFFGWLYNFSLPSFVLPIVLGIVAYKVKFASKNTILGVLLSNGAL